MYIEEIRAIVVGNLTFPRGNAAACMLHWACYTRAVLGVLHACSAGRASGPRAPRQVAKPPSNDGGGGAPVWGCRVEWVEGVVEL